MTQIIKLWQLNHDDQDMLWINNKCPMCDTRITEKASTEDYITWNCSKCGITYIVE